MQISGGGNHIHHHGLLSGLGAGAVGVLAVLALMFAAWGQVSHAVGTAATVIIWALAAGVVAFVAVVFDLWDYVERDRGRNISLTADTKGR